MGERGVETAARCCRSLASGRLWLRRVHSCQSIGTKCGQECFLKGNPKCYEQKGGEWAADSQSHTRLCSLVTLLESVLNTNFAGFYTWAKIV